MLCKKDTSLSLWSILKLKLWCCLNFVFLYVSLVSLKFRLIGFMDFSSFLRARKTSNDSIYLNLDNSKINLISVFSSCLQTSYGILKATFIIFFFLFNKRGIYKTHVQSKWKTHTWNHHLMIKTWHNFTQNTI